MQIGKGSAFWQDYTAKPRIEAFGFYRYKCLFNFS